MRSLTGLREWVALDLETTGLSSDTDDIIEIGAVKFAATGVVDEFHSLVNPRRRLPTFIKELTGITQSEVDSAPSFSQVSTGITEFLRGSTLVAHNAGFDVGFLRAKGLDILPARLRHMGVGLPNTSGGAVVRIGPAGAVRARRVAPISQSARRRSRRESGLPQTRLRSVRL